MKPSIPKPTSGHVRFVRNSNSRCGCGGAQVFECVHDLTGRIERRRLTLDDCDGRRRDRVQRECAEVEIKSSDPTSGHRRFVRNSQSRCGYGGAQVFECVGGSMPRIERRRLTLDDRDDRRRDRVQRERPKVGLESSNPISGSKKQKQSDNWTHKENLTDDDVTKKNRTKENRRQRDRTKT